MSRSVAEPKPLRWPRTTSSRRAAHASQSHHATVICGCPPHGDDDSRSTDGVPLRPRTMRLNPLDQLALTLGFVQLLVIAFRDHAVEHLQHASRAGMNAFCASTWSIL